MIKTESKFSSFSSWILSRPKLSGFLVFIILICAVSFVVSQRYLIIKENERREMSNILHVVQQNINQNLKYSYTTALTLALTINDEGKSEDFEAIAEKLKSSNSFVDALQLLPDGVIKYVYPLKGNEVTIDFDIINTNHLQKEALESIKTKKMYFAGPLNLKQGGVGVVGRLPVYKKNKFWGFSAVVVRLETLLQSSGINSIDDSKYYFQFSKINPLNGKEVFFLSNKTNFSDKTFQQVSIPDGDWKIYLINKSRYGLVFDLLPSSILGFLFACILSLFIYSLLKKPYELQILVHSQATKLLNNELKFKTIFQQAAVGIVHVNTLTGDLIEINKKFSQMLGYSFEELLPTSIKDVTHPDDYDENYKKIEDLKNKKIRSFSMQKRYIHKNGSIIWVNMTTSPLWKKNEEPSTHISIVEDITIKKASEEIIIQSQKKLESLIDTIDGIVWECDYDTYNFTYINNKAEEITGYTKEEWMSNGSFWGNTIHPDDREWVLNFCSIQSKTNLRYDFEYRMLAKDGSIIWIRDIVNVIKENGKALFLKGIMIDITESKKVQVELKNSFNLVTEQNKRLLNFSYIVSHNLRSHTSNIQSISSLIESSESEEERFELITMLQNVSNTLNETMLNLNEVVNIQTNLNLIIERLNLSENINKTTKILSEQIQFKKAMIQNNVAPEVFVNYNPAYLESILLNFISNALRYSHSQRIPTITLKSYVEKGKIVLEIADNGIGIDLKKYGDKLFGMYKTFHENPDSKGIGLFITKNQIDAMDGNVTVESEPNVGTTFKIYFK